jgi:CHAD domain-containing protein
VLLERLRDDIAQETDAKAARSLLGDLDRERSAAYASAVETLSEARYLALLDRLEREAAVPVASGRKATRLKRVFRDELERCRRTFGRLGRAPSDEALHQARIRVKRARYAAELAAHELGADVNAFLQAAKKLQDVLGEHQDAVVAQVRIGGWVEKHPGSIEFAERLIASERSRQATSRKSWPKLWRKLERRGHRL